MNKIFWKKLLVTLLFCRIAGVAPYSVDNAPTFTKNTFAIICSCPHVLYFGYTYTRVIINFSATDKYTKLDMNNYLGFIITVLAFVIKITYYLYARKRFQTLLIKVCIFLYLV